MAEADQTLSDRDQTLSDRDQSSSERDQMASDADQAASDRDLAARRATGALVDLPDYHLSRVQRLSGTAIRHETRENRASASAARDENASQRDRNSSERDRIADRLDRIRLESRRDMKVDSEDAKRVLEQLEWIRSRAADDRREAAADRAKAAEKRLKAARDRERAEAAYRAAIQSSLAGDLVRGAGDLALEEQLRRAQAEGRRLTLIDLTIDGLTGARDEDRQSLDEILGRIRDGLPEGHPVVRNGDGGFVFAIEGDDPEVVLDEIRSEIDATTNIGLAELDEEDTLAILLERARHRRDEDQDPGPAGNLSAG